MSKELTTPQDQDSHEALRIRWEGEEMLSAPLKAYDSQSQNSQGPSNPLGG
jgi:hypothetical protein